MKAVRRQLEKELEMGDKALDEHKDMVAKLVDKVTGSLSKLGLSYKPDTPES